VTRKSTTEPSSGYTILLTDDNLDYLQVTGRLLEREGHVVITASSGAEALAILRKTPVDLLLLDYYMPGMTGEQVVTELRQFNPYVQVILQTGYASEQPPRTLLRRLDIQGYYDKSEGPDKLLLWTEVGLKSAYVIQLLNKSRQGLRYILDVTPDMHKIQSLADLLQGILLQVSGLLGATNSFLALLPEGGGVRPSEETTASFLAMMEEDNELVIRASTGSFEGNVSVETYLSRPKLDLVRAAVTTGDIQIEQGVTVVPLRVSESTLGIIYLDRAAVHDQDIELLSVFANQAAVAIQNAQLYEMATLDQLSGAYLRRFFEQWMLRELRTAWRAHQTIALLVVDIDGMKHINDTGGHLAGDQALSLVGGSLREAVRTTDVVGRYGGDEFAVVLPQTSSAGAERVAERILQLVQDKALGDAGELPVRLSIGLAVLEAPLPLSPDGVRPNSQKYFNGAAKALFQRADEALYQAKREGGQRLCQAASLTWNEVPHVPDEARATRPPVSRSQTPPKRSP
jgi:diguanylate cyclase (GGDEF)-like protein